MSFDSQAQNWQFYEQNPYTWTDQYYDSTYAALNAYNKFPPVNGSNGIPQTYLIDRDGTVRKARLGGNAPDAEWRAAIEQLLGSNFE